MARITRPPHRPAGGPYRKRRAARQRGPAEARAPAPTPRKGEPKAVEIPPSLTVKELAGLFQVSPERVIKQLLTNGLMATINQTISYEAAAIVAHDLGIEPRERAVAVPAPAGAEELPEWRRPTGDEATLWPRPPVVTVMGHVDHGKTTLLDAIRETNVTATEAGSITQHIGAYQVEIDGRKITFLDTPGHEAFTAMRARGAQATDVAVIVVAADDGVMPQTVEAIDHARAAKVPIVVAINKIDRPEANQEQVKQQLTELSLVPEEWGGDTVMVPVSARRKTGLDRLLEMILLVADLQELRANLNQPGQGVVVEARLDKERGPVATVLVQQGRIKAGDYLVAGATYGRVRAMLDDRGRRVKRAEPAMPVEVLGLMEVPCAGDKVEAVPDEKTARNLALLRLKQARSEAASPARTVSLEELSSQIQAGQMKELNLILKTDVQGSVEPIRISLERLSDENVKVRFLHQSPGSITEADVLLASASQGIIIGFNTRVEPGAKRAAEAAKVDIRLYSVIYDLVDNVKKALGGMLEPRLVEVVEGHAEVRQVFTIRGEPVAGAFVSDGKIARGARVRLRRGGETVYEGRIASLRRFKDDVREVAAGFECGIGLEGLKDLQVGDIVEAYREERR